MFKVDSFPLGVFVDSSETSFPICLMFPSSGGCTCLQLSHVLFTAPRVSWYFQFLSAEAYLHLAVNLCQLSLL